MTKLKWFVLTATTAAFGVVGIKLYRRRLAVDDEPEEGAEIPSDPVDRMYEDAEMPASISARS